MAHNFKQFPELANSQMDIYYFSSPHKQILRDFTATVKKVTDGDTIRVKWAERDFDFPVRFLNINAPEMSETRGPEVRDWLAGQLEDEVVDIKINKKNRVDKFGRLLGEVIHRGINMGNAMMGLGMVTRFDRRHEGKIPNTDKSLNTRKWF